MNKYLLHLCLGIGFYILTPKVNSQTKGAYITGDFHQHTTYTDGSWSIEHLMKMNKSFGLDWWANSEHGGNSLYYGLISGKDKQTRVKWSAFDPKLMKGYADSSKMWRWQTILDYSFEDVQRLRLHYPDKIIFQGLEWNVPGHEHASTCILGNQYLTNPDLRNASDIAQFEYRFDRNDLDSTGGAEKGWVKSRSINDVKMFEALDWLNKNHPMTSWVIVAHPERKNLYTAADFRRMNNAAPTVCFGFEGIPGHQKREDRGEFKTDALGGATYGGCGYMTAKVGGVWDALLAEGRNWFVFANSDFHDTDGDFWPGEYLKNYTWVTNPDNPVSIIDGLRSGNNYVVMGDLISELSFTISSPESIVGNMGQTINVSGKKLKINIKVHDPESPNHNKNEMENKPVLDHIDLIAGTISGLIKPSDPGFTQDSTPNTKVIARFDATGMVKDANGLTSIKWKDLGNGWKEVSFEIKNMTTGMYFRLRGTNIKLNTPGESDAYGNPLPDTALYPNNEDKAYRDLWFYSNPIFVKLK
ncbi:MAG: hypothetical protein HC905_01825 [Bacteroidales bacterium]|nr:hypothetical protein [Bacteroidales bacterium]